MEFHIDRNSDIPFERQIQDYIRMAMLVGALKKGDALPSIRDVEKQTGVNRGAVHRAYQSLVKIGMISLVPGKGAVVAAGTISSSSLNRKCEFLTRSILSKVRRMSLSPTAFARYLQRRAQESEREKPLIAFCSIDETDAVQWAKEISRMWGVCVKGVTYQQLRMMLRDGSAPQTTITHQMQYHLLELVDRRRKAKKLSISAHMTKHTMRFLKRIRPNSDVLMIQPDELFDTGRWPDEGLESVVTAKRVRFSVVPNRKILKSNLTRIPDNYILTPRFNLKLLPQQLRRDPRIFGITLELDAHSLEATRIKAGVII